MATLYATDLDGTLLDAYAKLSPRSVDMYRHLVEQGVLITFVTARTPATVEPILAPAQPVLPGVVMTGAGIWNPPERRYESVIYLTPSQAASIADICRQVGVTPFVYTLPPGSNSLITYHQAKRMSPLEQSFVEDRTISDLKTFRLGQQAPPSTLDHTVLYFAMGAPEKIRQAAIAIRQATPCYASWYPDTYNPGVALLEVFAPGVSKAAGLMHLKQMLGADTVVAFGDNLNDLPMLQAADWGVAVGNANFDVKHAADEVIDTNLDDAVLEYIMYHEQLA